MNKPFSIILLTVALLGVATRQAFTQEVLLKNIITNPAISERCKRLLEQRDSKIKVQQRLHALIRRNDKLLEQAPNEKESIRSKLKFTQTKIRNNIQLTRLQIQRMEENIVRSGCPGIAL